MLKFKKIMLEVITILTIALLIGMSVQVLATGESDNPIDLSGNIDLIFDNDTTGNDVANTAETNTQQNGTSVVQPTTNTSGNLTNTLPKTGVTEDITVMFFIIVCVVSAMFAYKKIRDYKA